MRIDVPYGSGFLPPSRIDEVADLPRWRMKPLGEDVCQLLQGVDSDRTEMTVLDRLVGEVLADVNVLRPLTAADDVVAPFDARVVVLVDRRPFLWCDSGTATRYQKVYQLFAQVILPQRISPVYINCMQF